MSRSNALSTFSLDQIMTYDELQRRIQRESCLVSREATYTEYVFRDKSRYRVHVDADGARHVTEITYQTSDLD